MRATGVLDPLTGIVDWLVGLLPTSVPPVTLPADERGHTSPGEWWYFVGHLTASDGSDRRYAFEVTVVRVGDPVFGVGLEFLGYFAFVDLRARSYEGADRLAMPSAYTSTPAGFRVVLPEAAATDWVVESRTDVGGRRVYELDVATAQRGVHLDLQETKPAVLHGQNGVADFGGGARMSYYSRTRLAVTGMAWDGQVNRPVTGLAWMDHEWGLPRLIGRKWKFFAIQLDDNTDLAVYRVWRKGTPDALVTYGARIDAGGGVAQIAPELIEITDPNTPLPDGYPVHNRITIAAPWDLSLLIVPYVTDQRRRPSTPHALYPIWWEGACQVTGTGPAGAPLTGRAFVELGGWEPIDAVLA